MIGLQAWVRNYLTTFIFLFLIPTGKRVFTKAKFEDLEGDLRRFANLSLGCFGFRVELINPHDIDLGQSFILASNHRSWFDQISLMASFPRGIHFLAKSDYFKIPILGRCMKLFEMIPVKGQILDKKASQVLIKSLRKDEQVCFFLEGTRGQGRDLLPFKKGAFQYAAKFNKPILPLYILGSEYCSSKSRNLLDIRPGTISIVVGKPIIFNTGNLEQQSIEFEDKYRLVHNKLYQEHAVFMQSHATNQLCPDTLLLT